MLSKRQIVKATRYLRLCVLLAVPFGVRAEGGFNDNIDRTDPNFVKASLLVFGPGESLYSCAGHACFRLECPKFNLDYCFSYEGESASDQIIRFFLGKLKMGMFAVPTHDFLKEYEATGRGVRQYTLNLSPQAKQRLWKKFDELVAKGPDLPYDYIKRGCAQSTLYTIMSAIPPEVAVFAPVPNTVGKTRREILHSYISDSPWTCLMLHMMTGPEGDVEFRAMDKIITPDDMLTFLRNARVNNVPLLTEKGVELLPQTLKIRKWFVTPLMVAFLLLVLAFAGYWKCNGVITMVMLAVQTFVGLLETHIVFFSSLPASSWNWLIIPFNVLPAIFWRWRRRWALPFVGVLLVWEAFVLLSPHRLTDPAFYVLVAAYIVFYLKFTSLARKRFEPPASG